MTEEMIKKALNLVGLGYIYGAQGQVCSPAFRRQQANQYPEQAEKIMGIGAKWDGVRVWECAQLTQEVAAVGGVKLPSGATSQWTKTDWDERGTIDTLPENELVFVYRQSKTNASKMQHTGVYLGDGTVVDARGTADGVVNEPLDAYAWTHWARPKWGQTERVPVTTRPTLRRGAIGEHVTAMQLLLLEAGYTLRKYGADGDFGAETEKALREYQQGHGLEVDGVCGPKTWAQLEKAKEEPKPNSYSVTIKGLSKADAEKLTAQYGGIMMQEVQADAV